MDSKTEELLKCAKRVLMCIENDRILGSFNLDLEAAIDAFEEGEEYKQQQLEKIEKLLSGPFYSHKEVGFEVWHSRYAIISAIRIWLENHEEN